jgi:hypothetical protein
MVRAALKDDVNFSHHIKKDERLNSVLIGTLIGERRL